MSCPDPETLLEFVEGRLQGPAEARFEEHLDACDACRELVAHAARHTGPRSPPSTSQIAGAVRAPPIPELANYRLEGILSQGGHGVVWRALDLRLDRTVALKQVRLDDPRATARFAREMRITARLSHPSIVKLHEAGVSPDGEQFYTMELVDGPTLLERIEQAKDLSARLALLPHAIAIAEALAYAHDRRIIHRDLKPANVVVGSFGETIILDWGLAKDLSANEADDEEPGVEAPSPGTTAAGAVLGTPSYMPPEQAAGHAADERSDVYAIGAILYQVLSGAPPYQGATSAEVLRRIVSEDPVPVEKLVPRVPPDLAAIVRRAMARAPEARYPTAKELAADLKKFTTGELVGAHRYRSWELAGHWVRRHRAIAASALAGVALLAAFWLERARSAQKAQLAQRFGQAVERIEGGLRQAHLVPLHDTRPEQARVRAQMRAIEAEATRLGPMAAAAASAALGRGHLALGELPQARERLEAAWAGGERAPEVAYALGRSLGALYQRKLAEVEALKDPGQREQQRRAIEAELRDPALGYLRQAEAPAAGTRAYLDGLIALHEQRLDEALAHADRALLEEPTLYEANLLAGEVHLRRCTLAQAKGDFAAAGAANDAAGDSFARAAEIARSDPAVLEADCERWATRQRWEGFSNLKSSSADVFSAAVAACRRVLVADPDRADLFKRLGRIHQFRGDYQLRHGEDPSPVFLAGIEALEEAARRAPGDAEALGLMGPAHTMLAMWAHDHGGDWRGSLDAAASGLERAMEKDPRNDRYPGNLGGVWFYRASFEIEDGRDPLASYAHAIAAQKAAFELNPRNGLNPYNLAVTWTRLSSLDVRRGLDPREHAGKAVEVLERAMEITPGFAWSYTLLGGAHLNVAEFEARAGRDAKGPAARARAALARSIELEPNSWNGHILLGRLERLRAEGLLGEPGAQEAWAVSRAELEKALKANANEPNIRLELARLEMGAAAEAVRRNAPAGPFLDRARALIDHVLRLNPRNIDALAADGQLLLACSRAEPRQLRRRELAGKALASLDKALARNSFLLAAEVGPARAEAARLAGERPGLSSARK